MDLSSFKLKKASCILRENFPRSKNKKKSALKTFFYFLKKSFSYISGNGIFLSQA